MQLQAKTVDLPIGGLLQEGIEVLLHHRPHSFAGLQVLLALFGEGPEMGQSHIDLACNHPGEVLGAEGRTVHFGFELRLVRLDEANDAIGQVGLEVSGGAT
eukprot:6893937-Alexandrium_andersonii.AAC.1